MRLQENDLYSQLSKLCAIIFFFRSVFLPKHTHTHTQEYIKEEEKRRQQKQPPSKIRIKKN